MPILDIQKRLTQLGVIRLGRQVPTGRTNRNGDPTFRPEKLDRFRITSPDRNLVEAVAAKYGGTPAQWRGPSGPEWEVITDAKALPVLVPPQKIDPNYEMWGKGFKQRLCDGATERIRNGGCLCIKGIDGHVHDFVFGGLCECGAKRECKPTTRLSLMLREIPGLGVLKLESHGRNAAAELPMSSDALENAAGPVPAMLVVQFVEKKILLNAGTPQEKVDPRSFYVPRLIFDWVTPEQAFGGQIGEAAKAMLTGAASAKAIEAAPDTSAQQQEPARSAKTVIQMVRACKNIQQLNDLTDVARAVDPNDPDLKKLQAEWQRHAAMLTPTQPAEVRPEPAVDAPVGEVVDAEVVDEPDPAVLWDQIIAAWPTPSTSEMERAFKTHQGVDMPDADGRQLAAFLAAIKSGEVTG